MILRWIENARKMHLMPREGTETVVSPFDVMITLMHLMPREGTETQSIQ